MQSGKQMKVSEILKEGLNNLKEGAAWGKGSFAMNEVGGFVSESSSSPAKFCAWGACRHVGHTKLHTDETTWTGPCSRESATYNLRGNVMVVA
jgi:hypothetical protein